MDAEYGKQMGRAIRAVLDMHADCVKLLSDLDKTLVEYESIFGNVVALNQGITISRRAYIAEGLIRLYARRSDADRVLGINICFYDENDPEFVEPILVVANTRYQTKTADPQEKLKRASK